MEKLRFHVARASSEDPEFPAAELNSDAHSPNTRGWQSEPFCDFPQELVLQFEGVVNLAQLQILSNECKIAQKVELFVGMCHDQLLSPEPEAAEWRRLGYLSLDSNERSGHKARELKDVDLVKSKKDTTGHFLRLVVHQCHVNHRNYHNHTYR